MLILTLRTDKPEAELGLFDSHNKLAYLTWQAHRELSSTIHLKTIEILESLNLSLKDLKGILIYKGPGSFTGLRIGFTVANTLSYGLDIPVVSEGSSGWLEVGLQRLINKENDYITVPDYGSDPHTTRQKK